MLGIYWAGGVTVIIEITEEELSKTSKYKDNS
jgi:hypothetical protein